METNPRPLVIFHGGCPDGLVSAWQVWRRYFDRADYYPGRYGDPPPSCTDRLVYIVDFSYPPEQLNKMADEATRIIVFDHHETAVNRFADWRERHDVELYFDLSHAGCKLTADYFAGGTNNWIVDYAEDRDLWKFELPNSREVNAVIATTILGKEPLEAFKALEDLRPQPMKNVVSQGKGALAQIETFIRQLKFAAVRMNFAGHDNIPVVNMAMPMVSDVLNVLNQDALFAAAYTLEKGRAKFSLRSTKSAHFNVAQLAEKFGGGGHPEAAGFNLELAKWQEWLPKVFPDADLPIQAGAC